MANTASSLLSQGFTTLMMQILYLEKKIVHFMSMVIQIGFLLQGEMRDRLKKRI